MSLAFLIMLIVFIFFMFSGMPLVFAMGLSCVPYFLMSGYSLGSITAQMFNGMDSFVLMAVPLFVLAGTIMNEANITSSIVDFSNLIVGRFYGGLAHVNVLASMFFGGCTGSALTDVAGLGSVLIPAMVKNGYEEDFSAAVTVSSSLQGPIIPPSIPMVIYSSVVGTSTGALLIGGAIPGILLGLSNMIVVYFIAKKRGYPRSNEVYSIKRIINVSKKTFPILLTPFILIGGIVSGIFTPTEAAAIAVLYTFAISFIFYVNLKISILLKIGKEVAGKTAAILILAGTSTLFGRILALEGVPQMISLAVKSVSSNPLIILLFINIVLLLWGTLMDALPALLILSPIFSTLVVDVGVNPVHFGVVMVFALMIGLMTPPYGLGIFTAIAICDSNLEDIVKQLFPFLIVNILVLFMITCIPEIVLFLPRIFGLIK